MPKQLTDNFTYEELNLLSAENRVVQNYLALATLILEPVRKEWGVTIVTSGYRPPVENAAAGGKPQSFHLADGGRAAADIKFPVDSHLDLLYVFDWVRLSSHLPFDKVILEFHPNTRVPDIIHFQYDKNQIPRRLAYEGFTGDAQQYTRLAVV